MREFKDASTQPDAPATPNYANQPNPNGYPPQNGYNQPGYNQQPPAGYNSNGYPPSMVRPRRFRPASTPNQPYNPTNTPAS
ncbi:MAG: hypothetical protein WKG07_34365 [Hymenobacter sp.]